jgi:hypothetical protein
MKIPNNQYTLESFMEYIISNLDRVFGGRKERKTLKAYLLYVLRDWKTIFGELQSTTLGDIVRVTFEGILNKEMSDEPTEFYIYEWEPGLILMFTSSTKEEYEMTLKNFIIHTRGITQSWIRPSLLDEMRNYLIERYDARVYHFIARRQRYWKYPARVRPDYDRRINYSGEDANQTLKEVQDLYGMIPSSIDLRIQDWKMQINRNGLFIIRQINRKSVGILQELIKRIFDEQIRIRNTSEKFITHTKNIPAGAEEIKIPRIVAGKIVLPKTTLSQLMVDRMFHPSNSLEIGESEQEDEEIGEIEKEFSFIDTYVREGPLVFAATVVDEDKGTVFGISGSEREVTIIPKHRTTFESFIRFYDLVALGFDYDANLTLFSEELLA